MRLLSIPLLLCAVLLAGCGSAADHGQAAAPTSATGPAAGGTTPTEDAVMVTIDPGDGSEASRYTLSCAPVGGTLPDAAAACAQLEQLDDPFAPVPADALCTQQYGGPQTAQVTGRWGGQDVDLQLSRTDGCRISAWDRLGPLLPGPVG